jgi:hypothetical protein
MFTSARIDCVRTCDLPWSHDGVPAPGAHEASAKKNLAWMVFHPKPDDWTRLMCDPVMGPFGGQSATRDVVTGMYVGKMSDPARVRREVEAKRAILAMYENVEDDIQSITLGDVLIALTAVYSGHPDYDEAWRLTKVP